MIYHNSKDHQEFQQELF